MQVIYNGSHVNSVGANKRVLYFHRSRKQRVDNTAFRNLEFYKVLPAFI